MKFIYIYIRKSGRNKLYNEETCIYLRERQKKWKLFGICPALVYAKDYIACGLVYRCPKFLIGSILFLMFLITLPISFLIGIFTDGIIEWFKFYIKDLKITDFFPEKENSLLNNEVIIIKSKKQLEKEIKIILLMKNSEKNLKSF